MTNTVEEELLRAKQLLKNGNNNKALEIVKVLYTRDGLHLGELIACSLLESQIRIKLNEFDKALALAEEALHKARKLNNIILILDVLITKAQILWRSDEFEKGIQTVGEGEKLLAEIELKKLEVQDKEIEERKAQLMDAGGVIYWYKGELNDAMKCYQQSLDIYEKHNDKIGIASVFHNMSLLYQSKGDLDKSIECSLLGLAIFKELGNKSRIASSLNNLGIAYKLKGDHNKALEYHQQSLVLKEEIGNKFEIGLSLLNLGVIYRDKGELKKAIEYYQQCKEIFEDVGNQKNIALTLNNLGDVYQLKGDLDLALEYLQQSLSIYEQLGIKQEVALALLNIGEVYRNKEQHNYAHTCYNQSLEIYEELGNDHLIAIVLYELVWLSLDEKNTNLAQQYLQKLQLIKDRTDDKIVDQHLCIARALLLKSSNRTRDRFKALEIFKQLNQEEVTEYNLTVTIMIHLCDLLLFELKMTGEEDIIDEIKILTHKLADLANQQSSHLLLVEAYVLQSKFALLELDINKAQKLLDEALLIAEKRGLKKLAIKIFSERANLEAQIEKWQYLIKHEASMKDRLELARLEELISNVVSKRFDVTDEEIKNYAVRAKRIVEDWG